MANPRTFRDGSSRTCSPGFTANCELPAISGWPTWPAIRPRSRRTRRSIALPGIRSNGIDYAIDAVRAGAVAVIYEATDDYSEQRIALLRKQVETCWIGIERLDRANGHIVSRFFGDPAKRDDHRRRHRHRRQVQRHPPADAGADPHRQDPAPASARSVTASATS